MLLTELLLPKQNAIPRAEGAAPGDEAASGEFDAALTELEGATVPLLAARGEGSTEDDVDLIAAESEGANDATDGTNVATRMLPLPESEETASQKVLTSRSSPGTATSLAPTLLTSEQGESAQHGDDGQQLATGPGKDAAEQVAVATDGAQKVAQSLDLSGQSATQGLGTGSTAARVQTSAAKEVGATTPSPALHATASPGQVADEASQTAIAAQTAPRVKSSRQETEVTKLSTDKPSTSAEPARADITPPTAPTSETARPRPELAADQPNPDIDERPMPGPAEKQPMPGPSLTDTSDPIAARIRTAVVEPTTQTASQSSSQSQGLAAASNASMPAQQGTAPQAVQASVASMVDRTILPQIVSSIQAAGGNGTIDVHLDPPELGRIEIVLELAEQGLRATLTAERGNTADMIRRNADVLMQQFSDAGFEDVDLAFGDSRDQQASNGQSDAESPTGLPSRSEATSLTHVLTGTTLNRLTVNGLDLKL